MSEIHMSEMHMSEMPMPEMHMSEMPMPEMHMPVQVTTMPVQVTTMPAQVTTMPAQVTTMPAPLFNIQSNEVPINNIMINSSNIPEFKLFQSNIVPNNLQDITNNLGSNLFINEPMDSYEDYGIINSDNSNKYNLTNYCKLPTMTTEFNKYNDNVYATF